MCKLKGINVAPHVLPLLHQSMIQTVLLYCSPFCFQYARYRKPDQTRCCKNLPTPNLTNVNNKAITHIAIEQDATHQLNEHPAPLLSGRRYTACFAKSLIPSAISTTAPAECN